MTQKMVSQELIEQMNKQFLGKRISVEGDVGVVSGTCQFMGYNLTFPSWGFQVTVDRMPVTNVKLKSIKLID